MPETIERKPRCDACYWSNWNGPSDTLVCYNGLGVTIIKPDKPYPPDMPTATRADFSCKYFEREPGDDG